MAFFMWLMSFSVACGAVHTHTRGAQTYTDMSWEGAGEMKVMMCRSVGSPLRRSYAARDAFISVLASIREPIRLKGEACEKKSNIYANAGLPDI